jgi:two-component system response regulator FixJ
MRDQDMVVFVVDDEPAARDSLTYLLRAEGLTCRAFADGPSMLQHLERQPVGCVVIDLMMPEMDGLSLLGKMREQGHTVPALVVSGQASVPLTVEAMKAGAVDLFEKPFDDFTLVKAVRRCLESARADCGRREQLAEVARRRATLTPREREVLDEVVAGRSSKEIGQFLGISPRTVEVHRANLMAKMQADGVPDLVRMLAMAQAVG